MPGAAPSRGAPRRRGLLGVLAASCASIAALRLLFGSGSAVSVEASSAFLSSTGLGGGGGATAPAVTKDDTQRQQARAAGDAAEEAQATRRGLLAAGAAAGLLAPGAEEARAEFGKAGCTMTVSFPEASCDAVLQLAKSRASGENGWLDPHNRGTYKVTGASAAELQGTRVTGLKGGPEMGGPFTDKWSLKFAASGGGCAVSAASTSTGFSFLDASTNYCNLHNLYASPDLKFSEDFESCNEHDTASCGPGDVMKR